MRHRKKKITLDRTSAARRALLKNLAGQVIVYEHVTTTLAKARAVRSTVERLITKSKKNTLSVRRELLRRLPMKKAVQKLLEEVGPRYVNRGGGYTRIVKLGARHGDGAHQARIELV